MDPELERSVQDVCEAAGKLGIKIVLVGGLFAEFTGEIGPDYPPFPKTNDADFAVYVEGWEAFGRLKDELLQRGFRQQSNIEHRLRRGATIVDLVPYGSRIAPNGKFIWPESKMEFVVTGFEEACAAARLSTKLASPRLPVVTIAGFVLLKTVAYLDRKERGEQKYKGDAAHIAYCLEHYASGEGDMRRFDLTGGLEADAQEYDTAGAVLLGREVRRLASPEAAIYVERFIRESEGPDSPFADAVAASRLGDLEKMRSDAARLVTAFKKGYTRPC